MKASIFSYLAAGAVLAAVAAAGPAQAQVSLSIGAPGFFGAIDIGGAPPPALVYQQPVMIQPGLPGGAPLYLYVPPEQYGNWGAYCGYYNACDRPVYFVQSNWYRRVYVPHYRSHRGFYESRRMEFARHAYHRGGGGGGPGVRYAPGPRPDAHRPPVMEARRGGPLPMAHPDMHRPPPSARSNPVRSVPHRDEHRHP